MKAFFLPLGTDPYEDFKFYGKRWELRILKGAYNPRSLVKGRKIRVSKGYNGKSYSEELSATIGNNLIGTLDEILNKLPLKEVSPRVNSRERVIQQYLEIYKKDYKKNNNPTYIAFELILE